MKDRRIQKTKKALSEALVNLILEKEYEKVTVQDILDRSNVGRSTFYLHYENKEQLLLDGHNNLDVPMFMDRKTKELKFDYFFDHIAENYQVAKAMMGKKSGVIMQRFFKNNFAHILQKKYASEFGATKAEKYMLKYLSEATGSAIVSLVENWLEDEMPIAAEEMARRCERIVKAVVS